MTEALRAAGFAVTAAMLCFVLRSAHRQAGAAAAIAAGLMLFFTAFTRLSPAVDALKTLGKKTGVTDSTLTLLLKLTAMVYVTELSAQLCRDAGEEGLAVKAALCGKMLLMAQTLPLILEIGEMTLALVP